MWADKLAALMKEVQARREREANAKKQRQKSATRISQVTPQKPPAESLEIKQFSKAIEIQLADNDPKKPDIASPRKADKEIEEKFEQELDQFSKRLEE